MFKFERNRSYMMPAHFGPRDTGGKATGWYRGAQDNGSRFAPAA